jgi:hypothetical protein
VENPIYDYVNQAWTAIINGRRVYIQCGHPSYTACGCYGRLHGGEILTWAEADRVEREVNE